MSSRSRFNRRGLVVLASAAVPVIALAGSARGQSYIGANLGSWDLTTNWNPAAVPNSSSVIVDVSNNATVVIPGNITRNVGTLTIGTATSGVTVSNNSYFNISGSLTNAGTITLAGTGGDTRLRSLGGVVTFGGTGAVVLNSAVLDGGGALANAAGHTIRGWGNVGSNALLINNAGAISANVASQTLVLDPANNANVNTGMISASNGGILAFTGSGFGGFDNAGGTFRADTGSELSLTTGATISGGTVTTAGTGVVRVVAGQSVFLNGITNGGNLRVANGGYGHVYGAVVNNGSITLDNTGGDTRLRSNGDATFSGTGTINMPSGGLWDGGSTVTIGSGQTVSGQGNIGANSTIFVNNGLIRANVNGATLTLDPANTLTGFDNNATIIATGGGIVSLTGSGAGVFENAGGTYRAEADSQIQLTVNARINGGTVTTIGSGKIVAMPNQNVFFSGVTNGGDLRVGNASYTYISGTFTNNNAVTLDTIAASDTRLRTEGADMTIAGTGTINMPAGGIIDGGARMTIGAGQTIRGQGNIGLNNTAFTSAATIEANVAGATLTIDPANVVDAFINNGPMRALNGGILSFTGNGFGNVLNSGGSITASGANSQVQMTLGSRIVGGSLSASGGGLVRAMPGQFAYLQGVTLTGPMTIGSSSYTVIEGSLTNNGTINFAPVANSDSRLRTNGAPVAISGNGTIVLDDTSVANASVAIDGGSTVTLGAGQTVRGSGAIGLNNTLFINNGIVDGDKIGGAIVIDPANDTVGFTNNNIVRATAGGKIVLTGSGFGPIHNSAAAQILASGANSEVQLTTSVRVDGGTLATNSGGFIRSMPGQSVYIGTTTLNGQLRIEANNYTYLEGTLTNNGTITVAPTVGGNTEARLRTNGTDQTILGTGTIVLANSLTADAAIDGGARLTLSPGQTVIGSGSLGLNNTAFTNNGSIISDRGSINIDPANAADAFVNEGILRATTGGVIQMTGSGFGGFSGSGVVVADAGSTIRSITSANVNFTNSVTGAGTLEVQSSSDFTANAFRVGALAITGSGVARSRVGGGNAGTSKVSSLTINNNGKLDLTDHGMVVEYTAGNSPAATIRGYLASGRGIGAWNGPGIMSSLANATNNRGVGYGEASDIYATPTSFLGQGIDETSIVIRYTLLGDTNLDAAVNFDDLLSLAQNYSDAGTGRVWTRGDFTYDGKTNFDDLLALAQNYNATLALTQLSELGNFGGADFLSDFALAQSMVPEPASLSAILGLTVLGRRRRTH